MSELLNCKLRSQLKRYIRRRRQQGEMERGRAANDGMKVTIIFASRRFNSDIHYL